MRQQLLQQQGLPVTGGAPLQGPEATMQELLDTIARDRPEAATQGRQGTTVRSKALHKADVLGIETRDVQPHWLAPIKLYSKLGDDLSSPGSLSALDVLGDLGSSPGLGSTARTVAPLSPGTLSSVRAARFINMLGRTALFSGSPYINTALEAMAETGIPRGAATGVEPVPPRRTLGRLSVTCRAAAVRRARRLLSRTTPFRYQVPFADAVRVASQSDDRRWLPPLLRTYLIERPGLTAAQLDGYVQVLASQPPATQLQAVAMMVSAGFYFAAVKVVYGDAELLQATLREVQLATLPVQGEDRWQVAIQTWHWQEADKQLLMQQFAELQIITTYARVRSILRGMQADGIPALVRVERELLSKVADDLLQQLQSELQAAAEAAAQAEAMATAELQAQRDAARARQAQIAMQMAKHRARAQAQAAAAQQQAAFAPPADDTPMSTCEQVRGILAAKDAAAAGDALNSQVASGHSKDGLPSITEESSAVTASAAGWAGQSHGTASDLATAAAADSESELFEAPDNAAGTILLSGAGVFEDVVIDASSADTAACSAGQLQDVAAEAPAKADNAAVKQELAADGASMAAADETEGMTGPASADGSLPATLVGADADPSQDLSNARASPFVAGGPGVVSGLPDEKLEPHILTSRDGASVPVEVDGVVANASGQESVVPEATAAAAETEESGHAAGIQGLPHDAQAHEAVTDEVPKKAFADEAEAAISAPDPDDEEAAGLGAAAPAPAPMQEGTAQVTAAGKVDVLATSDKGKIGDDSATVSEKAVPPSTEASIAPPVAAALSPTLASQERSEMAAEAATFESKSAAGIASSKAGASACDPTGTEIKADHGTVEISAPAESKASAETSENDVAGRFTREGLEQGAAKVVGPDHALSAAPAVVQRKGSVSTSPGTDNASKKAIADDADGTHEEPLTTDGGKAVVKSVVSEVIHDVDDVGPERTSATQDRASRTSAAKALSPKGSVPVPADGDQAVVKHLVSDVIHHVVDANPERTSATLDRASRTSRGSATKALPPKGSVPVPTGSDQATVQHVVDAGPERTSASQDRASRGSATKALSPKGSVPVPADGDQAVVKHLVSDVIHHVVDANPERTSATQDRTSRTSRGSVAKALPPKGSVPVPTGSDQATVQHVVDAGPERTSATQDRASRTSAAKALSPKGSVPVPTDGDQAVVKHLVSDVIHHVVDANPERTSATQDRTSRTSRGSVAKALPPKGSVPVPTGSDQATVQHVVDAGPERTSATQDRASRTSAAKALSPKGSVPVPTDGDQAVVKHLVSDVIHHVVDANPERTSATQDRASRTSRGSATKALSPKGSVPVPTGSDQATVQHVVDAGPERTSTTQDRASRGSATKALSPKGSVPVPADGDQAVVKHLVSDVIHHVVDANPERTSATQDRASRTSRGSATKALSPKGSVPVPTGSDQATVQHVVDAGPERTSATQDRASRASAAKALPPKGSVPVPTGSDQATVQHVVDAGPERTSTTQDRASRGSATKALSPKGSVPVPADGDQAAVKHLVSDVIHHVVDANPERTSATQDRASRTSRGSAAKALPPKGSVPVPTGSDQATVQHVVDAGPERTSASQDRASRASAAKALPPKGSVPVPTGSDQATVQHVVDAGPERTSATQDRASRTSAAKALSPKGSVPVPTDGDQAVVKHLVSDVIHHVVDANPERTSATQDRASRTSRGSATKALSPKGSVPVPTGSDQATVQHVVDAGPERTSAAQDRASRASAAKALSPKGSVPVPTGSDQAVVKHLVSDVIHHLVDGRPSSVAASASMNQEQTLVDHAFGPNTIGNGQIGADSAAVAAAGPGSANHEQGTDPSPAKGDTDTLGEEMAAQTQPSAASIQATTAAGSSEAVPSVSDRSAVVGGERPDDGPNTTGIETLGIPGSRQQVPVPDPDADRTSAENHPATEHTDKVAVPEAYDGQQMDAVRDAATLSQVAAIKAGADDVNSPEAGPSDQPASKQPVAEAEPAHSQSAAPLEAQQQGPQEPSERDDSQPELESVDKTSSGQDRPSNAIAQHDVADTETKITGQVHDAAETPVQDQTCPSSQPGILAANETASAAQKAAPSGPVPEASSGVPPNTDVLTSERSSATGTIKSQPSGGRAVGPSPRTSRSSMQRSTAPPLGNIPPSPPSVPKAPSPGLASTRSTPRTSHASRHSRDGVREGLEELRKAGSAARDSALAAAAAAVAAAGSRATTPPLRDSKGDAERKTPLQEVARTASAAAAGEGSSDPAPSTVQQVTITNMFGTGSQEQDSELHRTASLDKRRTSVPVVGRPDSVQSAAARIPSEELVQAMQQFQEQLAHSITMTAPSLAASGPQPATPPTPVIAPPPHIAKVMEQPPTQTEIDDYARYLGMDVVADADLLYIAEWALTAPVPDGWTVHLDHKGNEFFYHTTTHKSTYEHPMDGHYKEFYQKKKAERVAQRGAGVQA